MPIGGADSKPLDSQSVSGPLPAGPSIDGKPGDAVLAKVAPPVLHEERPGHEVLRAAERHVSDEPGEGEPDPRLDREFAPLPESPQARRASVTALSNLGLTPAALEEENDVGGLIANIATSPVGHGEIEQPSPANVNLEEYAEVAFDPALLMDLAGQLMTGDAFAEQDGKILGKDDIQALLVGGEAPENLTYFSESIGAPLIFKSDDIAKKVSGLGNRTEFDLSGLSEAQISKFLSIAKKISLNAPIILSVALAKTLTEGLKTAGFIVPDSSPNKEKTLRKNDQSQRVFVRTELEPLRDATETASAGTEKKNIKNELGRATARREQQTQLKKERVRKEQEKLDARKAEAKENRRVAEDVDITKQDQRLGNT